MAKQPIERIAENEENMSIRVIGRVDEGESSSVTRGRYDQENGEGRVHTGTLYVHEVGVWRLHKALELVLLGFVLVGGVEEIDGESHFGWLFVVAVDGVEGPVFWVLDAVGNDGVDGPSRFEWLDGSLMFELSTSAARRLESLLWGKSIRSTKMESVPESYGYCSRRKPRRSDVSVKE
jgi:hypothetical protein